jgi:hypothetical protein
MDRFVVWVDSALLTVGVQRLGTGYKHALLHCTAPSAPSAPVRATLYHGTANAERWTNALSHRQECDDPL